MRRGHQHASVGHIVRRFRRLEEVSTGFPHPLTAPWGKFHREEKMRLSLVTVGWLE